MTPPTTKLTAGLPDELTVRTYPKGTTEVAYVYAANDCIDGPMHPAFATELVRRWNALPALEKALIRISNGSDGAAMREWANEALRIAAGL